MASFAPEEEELETMEDKIKYLRDRGVQIDIPGELRDKTPASTSSASFDLGIDSHDLMIVKVPYDDKQQVEEVEVSIQDPYTYEGDQLLSKLKPNFASNLGSYHFSRENAMPVNGYMLTQLPLFVLCYHILQWNRITCLMYITSALDAMDMEAFKSQIRAQHGSRYVTPLSWLYFFT